MNRRDRIVYLLSISRRPLAGIEIADIIGGIWRATTYADLAALQRDGIIKAQWYDGGDRRRVMYSHAEYEREIA